LKPYCVVHAVDPGYGFAQYVKEYRDWPAQSPDENL
jgi:hypothetical protein